MTPPLAHWAGAFVPLELVPLLVAATLYAKRASTLAGRGRPVPVWRQACFGSGLLLVTVALFSPIGHLSEELVLMHMVEHLLVGDIAALLLVLGLTGPLLQPLLAIPVLDRLRVLVNPAVAFPLWAIVLIAWHIPALYDEAYGGAAVHALEHTMFIFCGCLMWMALLGPLPRPAWFTNGWKLGYILAVRFTGVALGNVLMWSGTVFYDRYASGEAYWGISPLTDQSMAGVIMMVEGTLLTLGAFAWLFFRTAEEGTERQRLLELAEAHGVPLDEARAARAVAAGEGKRLEERLLAGKGAAGDGRNA
ncbi:MAG: cytochrome c oxidase assembly protein [Actinomycetota bacterium]